MQKLELVLLPPKEKEKVTDEDIARAYAEMINILSAKD